MKKTATPSKSGKPLIGFIGQGFIGKNYADDFEARGFTLVRYARSPEFAGNKTRIKDCDIVFIAVPTPTTPEGFKYDVVESVLPLIGKGKTAVIKSTILPGTAEKLQKKFPDIFVFHSPEFLTERTAAEDAAHPMRNIVGIPLDTPEARKKASEVIKVLPRPLYEEIMSSREAELVKYGGNCWFYFKVLYINMLYDLADNLGAKWTTVRDALAADPRIGRSHLDPVHQGGRGAGGHCFIKDFAAFSLIYEKTFPDDVAGRRLLESLRGKNNDLLVGTGKDLDLLEGVYGPLPKKRKK